MPLLVAAVPSTLIPASSAQDLGQIRGVVTRGDNGQPIEDATVSLMTIHRQAHTRSSGGYTLNRIPPGAYVIRFQAVGYGATERPIQVPPRGSLTIDMTLEAAPIQLADITVEGVSRESETLLEAPAAVSVVTTEMAHKAAFLGQLPLAFTTMPGVDVVQGDLHDFKVNARGFNSPTARNVLVLQDGRDLSIPFLGLQDWAALSLPPDDMAGIEFIRGPGSALYGSGAYAGVINIRTPEAREVLGSRIRVVGGNLATGQADLRHAGLLDAGRLGYRINLGYSRSRAWSRSRTRHDRQDFIDEYQPATDSAIGPPPPSPERLPLHGQALDSATGEALGDPDDLSSVYGSARADWYADNGAVATADGGVARIRNSLSVVGSGRVQILDDLRPWARAAWTSPAISVTGWYSGRTTLEPQVVLGSGTGQSDASAVFQIEGQHRTKVADRFRIIAGASLRDAKVNTKGTLLDPAEDDRSDLSYGIYGQMEFAMLSKLSLIGALRWDKSDLFEAAVTPRVGLIYRPGVAHAVRLTVNRAFLPPNLAGLYLNLKVASQNLSGLEDSLRATSLGPALSAVSHGTLFTTSGAVPVISHGNADLIPETVTSYEMGYRGQVSRLISTTMDVYLNRKSDFVTAILPAPLTNPNFAVWTAPSTVPESERAQVEAAVQQSLTPTQRGLTRLPDGSTAIVNSPGNAGLVVEWGLEVGLVAQLSHELSVGGSYAYYAFDVKEEQQGSLLEPNTPRHKGTASVNYQGSQGLDLGVAGRYVEGYRWFAGVFRGYIPTSVTFDASAGYRLTPKVALHLVATDLLDRQQFQVYGGSVEGRRVVGGVTVNF